MNTTQHELNTAFLALCTVHTISSAFFDGPIWAALWGVATGLYAATCWGHYQKKKKEHP